MEIAADKTQRDAARDAAKEERARAKDARDVARDQAKVERARAKEARQAAKKKVAERKFNGKPAATIGAKPAKVWSASSSGNLAMLRDAIAKELPVTQPGNLDPTIQVDGLGQNALHKVCENGWVECLKLLLEQPIASLNKQSLKGGGTTYPSGSTALHMAAMHGHAECAQLLIQADADIEVTNTAGETAFEVVRACACIFTCACVCACACACVRVCACARVCLT